MKLLLLVRIAVSTLTRPDIIYNDRLIDENYNVLNTFVDQLCDQKVEEGVSNYVLTHDYPEGFTIILDYLCQVNFLRLLFRNTNNLKANDR